VYGLRDLHTFDIVTMNVARAPKATGPDFRPDRLRARRDYDPAARLPRGTRGGIAFSRSGSIGVRVARGDDRADEGRHLGGAHGPSGVDSGADCAHDHDVGGGGDANFIFEEIACADAAAKLLRGERLAAIAGTDFAGVRISRTDEEDFHAAAPDRAIQTVPLQLPHVADARASRIAKILHDDPSDSRPLAELCRLGGASKRTVERLFEQDAGMTFGRWRQQLRLLQAMQLLAEGAKVTHAALEAGYSTPSAFISMFRKTLGTTPAAYFRTTKNAAEHGK